MPAPTRPSTNPSSMNGTRMNQLVAPTSFITATSRRRAKIASWIVLTTRAIAPNITPPATTRATLRRVANRASCSLMAWTGVVDVEDARLVVELAASWATFWALGRHAAEGGGHLSDAS